MQFAIKIIIAIAIITTAQYVAHNRPSLAGLISVMPLTGLIVMLWVWYENRKPETMSRYTLGAVWGIIPAILFFITAYLCFRAKLHITVVLGLSSMVWIIAAFVHQYFLGQS